MKEIWKDILGYEKMYQISNLGRIKSLKRRTINYKCESDKILTNKISKSGYNYIYLSKDNNVKGYRIHRLVAQAFIPNPENKPQVNHINGIKTDNRVENLEWCTAKENTIHAEINKLRKRTYKKINQYDKNYNFIKQWNSLKEAAKHYNKSKSSICEYCKGIRKDKNFIWEYNN